MRLNRLVLCGILLALAGCRDPGTYLQVQFLGNPADVTRIDVRLEMGARADVYVLTSGGSTLSFPTTAAFEIKSGAGEMTVTAQGANAAGPVTRRIVSPPVTIVGGHTSRLEIDFDDPDGGPPVRGDAGEDGGVSDAGVDGGVDAGGAVDATSGEPVSECQIRTIEASDSLTVQYKPTPIVVPGPWLSPGTTGDPVGDDYIGWIRFDVSSVPRALWSSIRITSRLSVHMFSASPATSAKLNLLFSTATGWTSETVSAAALPLGAATVWVDGLPMPIAEETWWGPLPARDWRQTGQFVTIGLDDASAGSSAFVFYGADAGTDAPKLELTFCP